APAAADLHPERLRPHLLRDHPAQGQRRLRRRQLPGPVRIHRTRPDEARRPVTNFLWPQISQIEKDLKTEGLAATFTIALNQSFFHLWNLWQKCSTRRSDGVPGGVREYVRDGGGAGGGAGGTEFAPEGRARAVRGAVERDGVHRAARRAPAQLALSDPSGGD